MIEYFLIEVFRKKNNNKKTYGFSIIMDINRNAKINNSNIWIVSKGGLPDLESNDK